MMRLLCCSVVLSLVMLSLAAEPKGAPLPPLPTFGCRPYEILPDEKTPTDVNKLRPHDIKAVIAFGDSMTAAFGAKAGKRAARGSLHQLLGRRRLAAAHAPEHDRCLQPQRPGRVRTLLDAYDQAGVVGVGVDDVDDVDDGGGSVVMLVIQCHWSRSSSWYAPSSSSE